MEMIPIYQRDLHRHVPLQALFQVESGVQSTETGAQDEHAFLVFGHDNSSWRDSRLDLERESMDASSATSDKAL
jgi:hypothetical protein